MKTHAKTIYTTTIYLLAAMILTFSVHAENGRAGIAAELGGGFPPVTTYTSTSLLGVAAEQAFPDGTAYDTIDTDALAGIAEEYGRSPYAIVADGYLPYGMVLEETTTYVIDRAKNPDIYILGSAETQAVDLFGNVPRRILFADTNINAYEEAVLATPLGLGFSFGGYDNNDIQDAKVYGSGLFPGTDGARIIATLN